MKRYNEFINESIRDKMVGKSKDEIIKDMRPFDIFSAVADNKLPKDYLPSREETFEKISLNDILYWVKNGKIPEYYKPTTEEIKNHKDYKKLDPIKKVNLVKSFDLDESLLPTDEEIDKNIEDYFKETHGISIEETEKLIKDLKEIGINAKLEIIKDRILEPGNIYILNKPIRVYYYQIQNGNHVILKSLTKKGSEKIVDEIKKYCISLSEVIITEPDGQFDSTTISVKEAIDFKK
jgi:hypothetical protein